jgi:cytidine deaminase
MEIINFEKLSKDEISLLNRAQETAGRSASNLGHQIGCLIKCADGEEFLGATNIRSRNIGSTCAERMALDQMHFHGNNKPKLCVLIGNLPKAHWRPQYSEDDICTPCGVCLETMRQVVQSSGLDDLDLICASWSKKRILKIKLSELFPLIY